MVDLFALLYIAIIAGVTWLLLYTFYYSPKAQIKRLWKEIHRRSFEIGKFAQNAEMHAIVSAVHQPYMRRAGVLIDAILLYHFSDSEDEEVVEYRVENTYIDRSTDW